MTQHHKYTSDEEALSPVNVAFTTLCVPNGATVQIGDTVLIEGLDKSHRPSGETALYEITKVKKDTLPLMGNDGGLLYYIEVKLVT